MGFWNRGVKTGVKNMSKSQNLPTILKRPETSYGTLIQSPSPFWAVWGGSQLARVLDFVFIDTEHTPLDRKDVSTMCCMYRGLGLPALVRVVDPEQARQALDGGASGVVLPYMETVEQVKQLHGAVKLRPFKGQLLTDTLSSGRVEGEEIADYIRKGGEERALVLNIESQAAIDNLEAMLDPSLGVDAVLIGPHDLSCNLGVPEQYSHPKFKEAVKTIFSKARAAGVGASIHHIGSLFGAGMENCDAARMVGEWGCNNIILGGDLVFFIGGLQKAVKEVKMTVGEEVDDEEEHTGVGAAV